MYHVRLLNQRRQLETALMLKLMPPVGHPRGDELLRMAESHEGTLLGEMQAPLHVEQHELLEPHSEVAKSAFAFAENSRGNILLDISSLPKRFFFLILQILTMSDRVTNLAVSYAVPGRYDSERLQEDLQRPAYLPGFLPPTSRSSDAANTLVASVGFESAGLLQLFDDDLKRHVHLLVPSPSPPPSHRRIWQMVQDSVRASSPETVLHHVSVRDVPAVYRKLVALGEEGGEAMLLAPYGPKTVSLAMALYTMTFGRQSSAIKYSQPKYYSPQYATGVGSYRGRDDSYVYVIKAHGRLLYGR
jgi:hypothetical protein